MNTETRTLNQFQKAYLSCIDKRMTEFITDAGSQARKEDEFCKEEKKDFFNYMKDHNKTEYENIIRVEQNNY